MTIDWTLQESLSEYYVPSRTFQCDGKIFQTEMYFVEIDSYLLWNLPPKQLLGEIWTLGSLWLVEFPYSCFHFFARFEAHKIPWWDVDDIARSRVSGDPTISSLDLKYPKISKFDPALFYQRVYECVECGLNGFLSFRFWEVQPLGNCSDDVLLGHGSDTPVAELGPKMAV